MKACLFLGQKLHVTPKSLTALSGELAHRRKTLSKFSKSL